MLDTTNPGDSSLLTQNDPWETTILAQPPFLVPSQPKFRAKFVDHFRKAARTKPSSRAKSSIAKKPTAPLKKRHSTLPDLVHDSTVSEESTPVSTPIHPEFDFRSAQGSNRDKAAASYGRVPLQSSPLAGKSKYQSNVDSKAWYNPCPPLPPAPRIDAGAFDTSYQDVSFDSSANISFSSMDAPVPFLLPTMERPILPTLGREQLDRSRTVEDTRPTLQYPPAPRPDTGAWSHMDVPNGLTKPGPFLPGIPAWMLNAPPLRSSCRLLPLPPPPPVRPRLSSNWNMGLGLDLHDIADIAGPALGENEFMRGDWGDLECELCLAELFPSIPRLPRPVPAAPAIWNTTANHRVDSGRRFGVGLGHGHGHGSNLNEEAAAVHGRAGYASTALGYEHGQRSMRRSDSVRAGHHYQSRPPQSSWTRFVEPELAVDQNGSVVYNGSLLPPIEIELGRRRVGK